MAPKLEDTCLCAIVRDEKVNPAGGILDYIESVVPYVDAAVIVDTGSIDGTREILEECAGKYDHLKILDGEFNGFADARNYSLKKGKKQRTKHAIVLDADERLTEEDFGKVNKYVLEMGKAVYHFNFYHVKFDTGKNVSAAAWGNRLFPFSYRPKFNNNLWETLSFSKKVKVFCSPVRIKHFLPPKEGILLKRAMYDQMALGNMEILSNINSDSWKEFNPHRDNIHHFV